MSWHSYGEFIRCDVADYRKRHEQRRLGGSNQLAEAMKHLNMRDGKPVTVPLGQSRTASRTPMQHAEFVSAVSGMRSI